MFRLSFTVLVVGCGIAATAAAQTITPRGDTLSLHEAVVLGRTANPVLAARAADVRAAGARIRPAGTLPDPQLRLGAMNYMLPGLSPRGDPLTMNQLGIMQMLPVNGTLGLRRRVARFDSVRVAAGSDEAQLQVERDVRARYWELYHVDQALGVMDRTVAVLRELASVAGAMYAVGTVPQSDVVRAQTAITRMEQEIEAMRLDRVKAVAELNAALGRNAETPIALPPQDPHQEHHAAMQPLATPPLPTLDSLVIEADSGSPLLGQARAMAGGARVGETVARRMLVPDLNVGFTYGQRAGGNDMLSLELGLSLPLYASGRQLRMRDEARAMRDAAESDLTAMRVELRARLLSAREEAETARRQIERIVGTLVPQASASYEAALAAYRVGRADFPSVLDAQMTLLQYQHDLHSYEAMYGTAVAEVDRLVGRSLLSPTDRQENR